MDNITSAMKKMTLFDLKESIEREIKGSAYDDWKIISKYPFPTTLKIDILCSIWVSRRNSPLKNSIATFLKPVPREIEAYVNVLKKDPEIEKYHSRVIDNNLTSHSIEEWRKITFWLLEDSKLSDDSSRMIHHESLDNHHPSSDLNFFSPHLDHTDYPHSPHEDLDELSRSVESLRIISSDLFEGIDILLKEVRKRKDLQQENFGDILINLVRSTYKLNLLLDKNGIDSSRESMKRLFRIYCCLGRFETIEVAKRLRDLISGAVNHSILCNYSNFHCGA